MNIESNLKELKDKTSNYPHTLVAVSKTKPNALIEAAFAAGQLDFGENKVQELVGKSETLPKAIKWHMIGHLQRNKVKYIAPFVHMVHSVDSIRLLQEINKQAAKHDRKINCLLQVHIAQETTKFGFDFSEINAFLDTNYVEDYPNVQISGLMGMATNTSDTNQIEKEFKSLRSLFDAHKNLSTLSMGMSSDYPLALACGSNMIRVGSAIFGARNYTQS